MVRHHPHNDMLLEHAAGTLPWTLSLGITAHLQMCTQCRQQSHYLNDIGGALLESAEPEAPAPSTFNRLISSIRHAENGENNSHPLEQSPQPPTNSSRSAELPPSGLPLDLPKVVRRLLPPVLHWEKVTPSLRVVRLSGGGKETEVSLYRIASGGHITNHNHGGLEITQVLSGSFSDAHGLYSAGDFLIQQPGEIHQPTATQDQPCYCLGITQAPTVPTALWGRLTHKLATLRT